VLAGLLHLTALYLATLGLTGLHLSALLRPARPSRLSPRLSGPVARTRLVTDLAGPDLLPRVTRAGLLTRLIRPHLLSRLARSRLLSHPVRSGLVARPRLVTRPTGPMVRLLVVAAGLLSRLPHLSGPTAALATLLPLSLSAAGVGAALLVLLLGRRLPAAAGSLVALRPAAAGRLVAGLLSRRRVPRTALRGLATLLTAARSLLSLPGTSHARRRLRGTAALLRATALLSLPVLFACPSSVRCVAVSHEYHRCARVRGHSDRRGHGTASNKPRRQLRLTRFETGVKATFAGDKRRSLSR
jgi:hypothetical protein